MGNKKIDLWDVFYDSQSYGAYVDQVVCVLCDDSDIKDDHFKEHHQKEFELFYRGILVCLFGACSECQPVPVEYKPLWTDFSRGIWKTRERICGNCGKIFQKDP